MEVSLNDDQQFFLETTRRFLTTECPIATVRELAGTEAGYEDTYLRQGAELGWTSLLISEEHGGGSVSGDGVVDLTIVADAFGRSVAPGPLVPTNVVASAIARSGSDEHRDDLLPGVLAGELSAAWCGVEHALGAPAPSGAPSAARSDGGFLLSGTSQPVEAAAQADRLLVTARTDDGLRQFLLPADAEGVTITPLQSLDLVRRYARVELGNVAVPESAVVGDAASTPDDVERQLQIALVMQAAEMVGAAETVFDFTVEWAFDRYSFGRPLASYQELKHRFADMKTWLEASHGLATALAREVGAGRSSASETASATKAYLGEYLAELVQDCVQMHGGIGLTADHDIHLYLRRVTVDRATFGTPAAHRQRIAGFHLDAA